jgi:O-antigen/teichoic acid export membrane protein
MALFASIWAIAAKLKSFSKMSADRGRERYRRVGITVSTSFLSKALTVVISFVSVPLTVHYLGSERYGVWLTISSLLTWMALTDFGLAGNALVNVISEASGRDDRALAREYASSAFWSLIAISSALAVIACLTFHMIPWRSVFQVSANVPQQELDLACALTLAMFVLGLPLNMLNSVYNAYQDGFVANVWGIASNALALAGLIVVSHFKGGLPMLVVALSGTRIAVSIASGWYAFATRYPWLAPAPKAVHWTAIKRLLNLGFKYMVTQLASLGIYQSQPMIITQLLGPSQVVVFVVAYKILALPIDLSYMATAPFISAFGEAKSRRDWRWIHDACRNSTLVTIAAGAPFALLLAVFAKPLIRVWAGPAAMPTQGLIWWLTVYTLIGLTLMAAGQMLLGVERLNLLTLAIAACAVAVVGLGILFAPWWGLNGIAFAMALSKFVFLAPVQIYETRRVLQELKGRPASEIPIMASLS